MLFDKVLVFKNNERVMFRIDASSVCKHSSAIEGFLNWVEYSTIWYSRDMANLRGALSLVQTVAGLALFGEAHQASRRADAAFFFGFSSRAESERAIGEGGCLLKDAVLNLVRFTVVKQLGGSVALVYDIANSIIRTSFGPAAKGGAFWPFKFGGVLEEPQE